MRCLVINGTGRTGGFCDRLSGLIEGEMMALGCFVDLVSFHQVSPEHCTGCGACRDGMCPISDGFSPVLSGLSDYDLVVFVSPIRFSGLSSQMKVFVDRFNPVWYDHDTVSARSCAVLVGGSDDPKFSNAESELRALSKGCGMEWCGQLEISGSDSSEKNAFDDQVITFVDDLITRM